jgi:hypothetical protein
VAQRRFRGLVLADLSSSWWWFLVIGVLVAIAYGWFYKIFDSLMVVGFSGLPNRPLLFSNLLRYVEFFVSS